MAINLTWTNIAALCVLLSSFLIAFFAGTAGMMEWRIEAVQSQLSDRMTLYQHDVMQIEKRLDRLEKENR